jgi:hypothetical protein
MVDIMERQNIHLNGFGAGVDDVGVGWLWSGGVQCLLIVGDSLL